MIASNSTLAPQIKSGRLRAIAVTSLQASPAFPGLLPVSTAVPGYAADIWQAIYAPAGTPAPLVQRLNREINEIMKSKETLDLLQLDGFVVVPLTPEQLASRVRESYDMWKKLAAAKHIVAE
jgi:tripartite-type tricarboxylate transporter receptor subunit TctC